MPMFGSLLYLRLVVFYVYVLFRIMPTCLLCINMHAYVSLNLARAL